MTSRPYFSIIMPTFNHANFISDAINSVIKQTFEDWELIIINNYSTDQTVSIIESFSDPRIKLFNFSNGGIIAASRNYGLKKASGDVIALLDSDDVWYPNKLKFCYLKLIDNFDVVCNGELWRGPGKKTRRVNYGPEKKASYERLLFDGNCLSTSASVFRKELLIRSGFFSEAEDINTAEDYDLWLRMARSGAKFGFIDEILGEYAIHDNNNSRGSLKNMFAEMRVFEAHIREYPRERFPHYWSERRRRALIYYSGARSLQDANNYFQSWLYFLKSFIFFPFNLKLIYSIILHIVFIKPR